MIEQKSIVQEWLDISKWAASGGNAQPWKIEFTETANLIQISLSIDPQYVPKHSPLDVNGTGALISLGGLAFYFIQTALHFNYILQSESVLQSDRFWDSKILLLFIPTPNPKTYFSVADLRKRKTNRLPYCKKYIPDTVKQNIFDTLANYTNLKVIEIQPKQKIHFINSILPLEKLRWKKKLYLENLLAEINFDLNNNQNLDQIPIDQLGLNKFDQKFIHILKKSKVFRFLINKFFYLILVAKSLDGFRYYCDRLFALQANNVTAQNCIELGKAFHEVWIMINKENIGFQPLGTPLVALGYWLNEEFIFFKKDEETTIIKTTHYLLKNYNLDLTKPTLIFRVGFAQNINAQTPRKNLIAEIQTEIKTELQKD